MSRYLTDLFGTSGRRAVVTGGSSGIGYAMAEALGRGGAAMTLVARSPERLADAASRLRAHDVEVDTVAADLSDRAALAGAAERIAEHGEPDILVNAAGVNPRPPMAELSEREWDVTMAVNLTAPWLLGQRFGPGMARRGFGRIVNIASQQSIRAFGNSGVYGVSKTAICGLTRSQAEAWSAHGVCCNAVAPGFVHTPLTEPVFATPGRPERLAARTMAGRNGVPEDFAGVVVFLASAASSYLTGQTIFVDGGFSAT
ncbi:gluconate 5-dehydrogenase [Stackebrandtia albiflava]|uniref:Gluconate 5-dehydrogenase n=1 Tax=Stackebrandtia albiflava TaxID=406432 RepID=A0A562VEI8_9ACTN|nr:SDR family oxidoreductase [Stackebrandtia albiflava]TWJ16241.1 gluconate 5-dehydrogenase [Stackebrandtia albiflava]